jgi:hypothetical protein
MKTVVVIGSGREPYREHALRSMAGRYRVVLVQDTMPTWQWRYVSAAEVVDTADSVAVVTAVRRHRPDGVLTWTEANVEVAARAAAALGLPGHPRDAAFRRLPSVASEPARIDASEISVESVVQEGRAEPVAITAKRKASAPRFEDVAHVVAADNTMTDRDEIIDVVVAAHEALGLRDGVTHAELELTAEGPRMVEIAACLGGDQIPRLVQLATGIDLARAAAAVSVGDRPDLTPRWSRAAGIAFRYPDREGRIESLRLIEGLSGARGVQEVRWMARPGADCLLPPQGFNRPLGYVLVTAADARRCWDRLDSAVAGMVVNMAALARAGGDYSVGSARR